MRESDMHPSKQGNSGGTKGLEHIDDHFIRKHPYGRFEGIFVFVGALLVSIAALITIGILQYDEYDGLIKSRSSYLETTSSFCKIVDFYNFDAISTPIAAFLLILYIFLYKRRSFCLNKCSWRNIGLPMIVSLWNRTDRIHTGLVYGRIAYEVFNIVQNVFQGDSSKPIVLPQPDPTGLFRLLMKIFEVILIGIRYYPILVAFRAKSCLIYFLSALYMWIDFGGTVYQQGKCETIIYDDTSLKTKKRVIPFWVGYKTLNISPTIFFVSYIAINLTYRALVTFIDLCRSRKKTSKNTKCKCELCDVNDDYEIIFSHSDLLYVLELFNDKKNARKNALGSRVDVFTNVYQRISHNDDEKAKLGNMPIEIEEKPKESKKPLGQKIKEKLNEIFRKFIYDWQKTFRFTSRFINCHIVALLALYHVFLFLLYYVVDLSTLITENLNLIDFKNLENLTLGSLTCILGEDFCIEELTIPIPVPNVIIKFGPEFIPSLYGITIAPMFCALLICLVQVFIGIRDTKKHLIELYKGTCVYVPPRNTLANSSIASNSFHYGGYLVGYLVWGFIIQYVFIVLIAVVITILRMTVGDKIFEKFLLKLVPVICVFVVKKIVNVLATRVIFLRRDTKVLALNNFRAFNVFLYFNFFFDCFMGIVSAVIRLIKSLIFAIFMMPRIAYSFVGRYLERMDNGYASYMGFLFMEAAHTNPIMITFCSLLYYKGLSEHVHMLVINDSKKKPKFVGTHQKLTLKLDNPNKEIEYLRKLQITKKYNKIIVNKWHVILFLAKNPVMILYRKDNLCGADESEKQKESKLQKIKNALTKCCKKESRDAIKK